MLRIILFLLFFIPKTFSQVVLAPTHSNQNKSPKALMVFLHGCKMDGEQFARTTGIAKYIETENIVALFPSQNNQMNFDHCWNWFLPINQTRFLSLEHFSIFDQISKTQSFYKINSDKTFLIGLSSGAAYAMNLISCFPEKFNGVAIHSGLSYLAATDGFYANQALLDGPQFNAIYSANQALLCGGKNHHLLKTIVIHGREDKRVYPINFQSTQDHFKNLLDLIDDGKMNQSFPNLKTQFQIKNPNQYGFVEDNYMTNLNEVMLKTIFIDQLEHKWSGGPKSETYSDPNGPDVTKIILDYFLTGPSKRHQE